LHDGVPYDIPDFTSETDRKKYEDDDWTPIPTANTPHKILPSVRGIRQLSEDTLNKARLIWEKEGYTEKG
jgi:hypothetical protein